MGAVVAALGEGRRRGRPVKEEIAKEQESIRRLEGSVVVSVRALRAGRFRSAAEEMHEDADGVADVRLLVAVAVATHETADDRGFSGPPAVLEARLIIDHQTNAAGRVDVPAVPVTLLPSRGDEKTAIRAVPVKAVAAVCHGELGDLRAPSA